jgi:hypothetical protein
MKDASPRREKYVKLLAVLSIARQKGVEGG